MPGGGAPVETRVALSGKSVVGVFFSGQGGQYPGQYTRTQVSRERTPRELEASLARRVNSKLRASS